MRRQAVDRVVHRIQLSAAWRYTSALLLVVVGHPWTRACLHTMRHVFAFIVADPFEDETVTFSKKRLTENDSYRDRLLAPEIADLVDLCDALQLSIPQRKAFFRCFLHLDAMRRAGVSRSELLRYCGLRDTPAVRVLLPSDNAFDIEASSHRSEEFRTQRWDIVQLLSLMFSLCTMDIQTLATVCLQQITIHSLREEAKEFAPQTIERDATVQATEDSSKAETTPEPLTEQARLVKEILSCLEFTYGVPNPIETRLGEFLTRIYCTPPFPSDFIKIHRVTSVVDVIALFPVLLFPNVWLQRVIKRRFLGELTWQKMATRRAELQLVGLSSAFVSASEIVHAANILVQQKQQHQHRWTWIYDLLSLATVALPYKTEKSPPPHQRSTPRKVLPEEGSDSRLQSSVSSDGHSVSRLSWLAELQNEDEAWRRTADSVLATVLVWDAHATSTYQRGDADGAAAFLEARTKIEAKTLAPDSVARIQRLLIREFGYQFATFVSAKSSIHEACGDLVGTTSVKKEERRARQRYQKADGGLVLVEDKAIYWKEYKDPLLKQIFYHNVRTGESQWETPAPLLKKRRKKGKRSPTRSSPTHKHDLL